jgi:hypothetical protein
MTEWDWQSNNLTGLNPRLLTAGSNRRASWICKKCGGKWKATIWHRANSEKRTGCPYCHKKLTTSIENLLVSDPFVASEWSDRNLQKPFEFRTRSNKKVWWRCSACGEEWKATIANRTNPKRKTGCPYCCNPPLRPSKSRNLRVMFPDISSQLHPTKNGDIFADNILPFANRKLWFMCERGHEYEMFLPARTKQGQGCPKCNKTVSRIQLRIFSEISHFYSDAVLEDRSLGVEVDILIPSVKIGIEIDGWRWHRGKTRQEEGKNKIVEGKGYTLIRLREYPLIGIRDVDVEYKDALSDEDMMKIVISIFDAIRRVTGIESQYGNPPGFYEEAKYRHLIAVRGKIPHDKTLQSRFPELVGFWSNRNNLTPSDVRYGEHRKVWWKCASGHEFRTGIWNMIAAFYRGAASSGCPYCSRRSASDKDNLATAFPHLVTQWDADRNGELSPTDFRPMSNKKVWWKCDRGHRWKAVIASRSSGCGCPVCYGR